MGRFRTALARRHATRVHLRAHLREERQLHRALAAAPTLESAHEIASLIARH